MRIKLIAGVREAASGPLRGVWIEFVSFPMTVSDHAGGVPEDDPKTLTDEDELRRWADAAFGPDRYEIRDMQIPPAALGAPAPNISSRLQAVDEQITAVNDAGFPTSELTEALDDLWQLLDGTAVVNSDLIAQSADELDDAARRFSDDAHELEKFPLEADAVKGYRSHAADLREKAGALRACVAPRTTH